MRLPPAVRRLAGPVLLALAAALAADQLGFERINVLIFGVLVGLGIYFLLDR
jgi:hypothetical protein